MITIRNFLCCIVPSLFTHELQRQVSAGVGVEVVPVAMTGADGTTLYYASSQNVAPAGCTHYFCDSSSNSAGDGDKDLAIASSASEAPLSAFTHQQLSQGVNASGSVVSLLTVICESTLYSECISICESTLSNRKLFYLDFQFLSATCSLPRFVRESRQAGPVLARGRIKARCRGHRGSSCLSVYPRIASFSPLLMFFRPLFSFAFALVLLCRFSLASAGPERLVQAERAGGEWDHPVALQ